MEKTLETKYLISQETEAPPPPYSQVCSVPIVTQGGSTVTKLHKRKIILGCGTKTWTQIIALVQILFSLLAIVKMFALPSSHMMNFSFVSDSDYVSYTDGVYGQKFKIFQYFVALALGSELLAGSYLEKPVLILVWLIASGVGLALSLLLLVVLLVGLVLSGRIPFLVFILVLLVSSSIQYFCFHVVSIHRREIIEEQKQNRPNSYLQNLQINSLRIDVQDKNSLFPYIQ